MPRGKRIILYFRNYLRDMEKTQYAEPSNLAVSVYLESIRSGGNSGCGRQEPISTILGVERFCRRFSPFYKQRIQSAAICPQHSKVQVADLHMIAASGKLSGGF